MKEMQQSAKIKGTEWVKKQQLWYILRPPRMKRERNNQPDTRRKSNAFEWKWWVIREAAKTIQQLTEAEMFY